MRPTPSVKDGHHIDGASFEIYGRDIKIVIGMKQRPLEPKVVLRIVSKLSKPCMPTHNLR